MVGGGGFITTDLVSAAAEVGDVWKRRRRRIWRISIRCLFLNDLVNYHVDYTQECGTVDSYFIWHSKSLSRKREASFRIQFASLSQQGS